MKRSVNYKLVTQPCPASPEGGLEDTKERDGGGETGRVNFLLWLAAFGKSKERQETKLDQHHHCPVPSLIVEDEEQLLVYMRGTENPSYDSYVGLWCRTMWSGRTREPVLLHSAGI